MTFTGDVDARRDDLIINCQKGFFLSGIIRAMRIHFPFAIVIGHLL
ncbi:hypothetical protein ACFL7M_17540 [Thermodesulfobacteriota bacterium]